MSMRYSFFISSNFSSLKEERAIVIDALLKHQMIPICMEHFTIQTNENFEPIRRQIDDSDVFILLLGSCYGSPGNSGKSWTQLEYEYAKDRKPVYAIICEDFRKLKNKELTSENELKQINFVNSIDFKQEVDEDRSLSDIISEIITNVDYTKCIGWRRDDAVNVDNFWEQNHQSLDIGGIWYHVHQKSLNDSKQYIRIGKIKILQDFDKFNYSKISFEGCNYGVRRIENYRLVNDESEQTLWSGKYRLYDNGDIEGIYRTTRLDKSKNKEWKIGTDSGNYAGIHLLHIVDYDNDKNIIKGTFNDVAPSQKEGKIYLFRNIEDRDRFVIDNFYNNGGNNV